MAVVVDVRDNIGAIKIFEADGNKHVDSVGTEEAGKLVIVPWNNGWFYYCVGSLQVGYMKKL